MNSTGTPVLIDLAEKSHSPGMIILGASLGVVFFLGAQLAHAQGHPHPWLADDQLPSTPHQWRRRAAVLILAGLLGFCAYRIVWLLDPPPVPLILVSLTVLILLALSGLYVSGLVSSYRRCFPRGVGGPVR